MLICNNALIATYCLVGTKAGKNNNEYNEANRSTMRRTVRNKKTAETVGLELPKLRTVRQTQGFNHLLL